MNKTVKMIFQGILLLTALSVFSAEKAAGIELANNDVKVRVLPERGGKIISISAKNWNFALTEKQILSAKSGLTNVRVWGDNFELAGAKWKVVSQNKRSIKMSITDVHPRPYLLVEKTITLPEKGAFIQVDFRFFNRNPVSWGEKFTPWIHNAWSNANGSLLKFGHAKGVHTLKLADKLRKEIVLAEPGNWSSWQPGGNNGFLTVSEQKPKTIYSSIGGNGGASLEYLYEKTNLEFKTKFILAPPDLKNIGTAKLPIKMTPAVNAKAAPAKMTDLGKLFRAQTLASGEFRFWKNTAYISCDVAIPLFFGVKPALKKLHELEIDVPKFVSSPAAVGDSWFMLHEKMTLQSCKELPSGGKRYRYAVKTPPYTILYPFHSRIFLRAEKPGVKGTLVYRSYLAGKLIKTNSVPLETIRIPKAKSPKNFKLWMGTDYALTKAYPDFDKSMRHLGFNGLCFSYNVPNKVISSDMVKEMNKELRKQGYTTAVMGMYFVPPGQGFVSKPSKKYIDLCAVDIDGKKVASFDFTARGDWMKRVAKRDLAHGMAQGFDIAISDYEAFFHGDRISFSKRTIDLFRKEWQKKYPNRPFVDPKVIARDPERYSFENAAWIDFKCAQYADYIKEMRKLTASGKTPLGWCTIPGDSETTIRNYNLEDHRRFCAILDWHMPMLYNNLYHSMPNYRRELLHARNMTKIGGKAQLAPTLSAGFWGSPSNFTASHTFYLLLETAMLGAKGAYIFPGFAGSDGKGIYYLSKAMNVIARMEKVLENARCGNTLVKVESAVNTAFKMPAGVEPIVVVNGKYALVYIAEYTGDPVEVKLAFDLSAPCRVTVLNGKFSPKRLNKKEKVSCMLTEPDNKALLLLLETENGSALKVPVIRKQKTAKQKKGVVLQDTFDNNKTIGTNVVRKHNFGFTPGFRGSALSLRDYESAWRFKGPKKLPGKNVELEFYMRLPHPRKPGSKGVRQPLILSFNNKKVYRLWILDGSGRLSLVEHQIMKLRNKRHEEPIRRRNSVSDRLPGNVWMKFQLKISPKEIALFVDGRKEIEMKPGYTVTQLDFLQFGNRWQSTGAFDEMVLTSN